MKTFLARPPYDRPCAAITLGGLAPHAKRAEVLRSRRRWLQSQVRAIDLRIVALLTGRNR